MAFLGGVLESVKDDDAVTKYDKNNDIKNLPFSITITQVSEALQAWSGELEGRTKSVTRHLETLSTNIDSNISSVGELHDFDVAAKQWRTAVVGALEGTLRDARLAIEKLDNPLQAKLKTDFDKIQVRIHDFAGNAERDQEEMRALGKSVERELADLRSKVIAYAETQKSICIDELRSAFETKIKTPIGNVQTALKSVQQNLEQWSKKANSVVAAALKKVEEILAHVKVKGEKKSKPQKWYNVENAAKALKEKADTLLKAVEGARKTLESNVQVALQAVKTMDKALKGDLNEVKININTAVSDYVRNQILTKIKTKVSSIKGVKDGDGLKGIKKRIVEEYAEKFKAEKGFRDIVEHWLTNILTSVPVIAALGSYVNKGTDAVLTTIFIKGDNIGEVAKAITAAFNEEIGAAVGAYNATITGGDDSKIEKHVVAVNAACMAFASKLATKMKESKTTEIAEAIKRTLNSPSTASDPFIAAVQLTYAVQPMLSELIGAARQAGNEVASFAGIEDHEIKIGKNLHEALGAAQNLEDDLKTGLGEDTAGQGAGTGGSVIFKEKVDNTILSVLNGKLPNLSGTSGGEVDIEGSKLFAGYVGGNGRSGKKEALEKEIGEILQNVKRNLDANDTEKEELMKDTHLTKALENVDDTLLKFADAVKELIQSSGMTEGNDLSYYLKNLKAMLMDDGKKYYGIDKDLAKIRHEIALILGEPYPGNPQGNLKEIVTQAQEFYEKTIKTTVENCVEKINQKVRQEVHDKIKALKKDAFDRYVEATTEDMRRLKGYVMQQREKMSNAIGIDSARGVKGLLDKLRRTLSSHTPMLNPSTLSEFAKHINEWLHEFFDSLHYQTEFTQYESLLYPPIDTLLSDLHASGHFNHTFNTNLDNLNNALHNFEPKRFSKPCSILLDALKDGLNALATQLGYAYVNSYSGRPWEPAFSANYSDITLTVISTLHNELNILRRNCQHGWIGDNINKSSSLGDFLANNGFRVSDKGKQNAELRNKERMKGVNIIDLLVGSGKVYTGIKHSDDHGPLKSLHRHLGEYYSACHLEHHSSPKPPTNILQMLSWLNGLWYNPVREPLCDYFRGLFKKPKGMENEEYSNIPNEQLKQDAYPNTIMYDDLKPALHDVCHHSHAVLTSILGNGHAGGIYACNFSNNSFNLLYPTDIVQLLCMLFSTLKRLYQQLQFLYQLCSYESDLSGWRDCWYGRDVGGSNWQCNSLQCSDQTCNQNADQTHKQRCDQKCDQHPKCGLKSPLQSFLEDGLQGFLPHNMTVKGSDLTCSNCPRTSPPTPCKTPMGFTDISTMASHRRRGQYIVDILADFCGHQSSPLTKICSLLNSLLPSAPQTLGDMFGFYYQFLDGWNDGQQKLRTQHREEAFGAAANGANFDRPIVLDVSPKLSSVIHRANQSTHRSGDLFSLVRCHANTKSPHPCGTYIQSISRDVYSIFSASNKNLYLSWLVYGTDRFYDLLRELWNECNRNCESKGSKCKMSMCYDICNSKKPQSSSNSKHDESCHSIVECKFTLPTFSKYGFYFESASDLSGMYETDKKRTCRDFCNTLEFILSEKNALHNIVHEIIPNFLKEIRWPFMLTLLALWSLSLLYLLHIAVVRLDVLRIRSHLRSPSSHRIAAQSLLAAARVRALANVKYFSP
ncbi:hypothetical protein, conserved [Babesia ovata]|uniref:Extracellular matrix-binding ebh n=1 Tax=Babesia ovata TaxID=189622 RepID=A0A2H6KIY4_9APIC|nr:uncharacterized protein BOVATA_044430 [Babesia ovata]GBE62950.1 hypothetical protein, conserved [Babesia ovata]